MAGMRSFEPLQGLPVLDLGDSPRTLVAGDIHLGYEAHMASEGIHLPGRRDDPARTLVGAARDRGAGRLVLLGDIKHTLPRPTTRGDFDLRGFFRALLDAFDSVDVCPGNHDGGLADSTLPGVTVHTARGFVREGVGFFHGHAWPAPELLGCKAALMAHTHPTVWFTGPLDEREVEACWVRTTFSARRVFDASAAAGAYSGPERNYSEGAGGGPPQKRPGPKKRVPLLIVPAMSPYGSGCAINHQRIPLLGPMGAGGLVDIDGANVFLLNGIHLGRAGQLPRATGGIADAGRARGAGDARAPAGAGVAHGREMGDGGDDGGGHPG